MDWPSFIQLVFAFAAGAWVYSCGGRHTSIVPGGDIAKAISERIAERAKGNGKPQMPPLPRVTS